MKDRVSNDIGAKETLLSWSDIDWKTVNKRVKNLRQRIYRATQLGRWNQVRSLMKLLMRSYSNLLLSVRRVTQDNQGRRTAGVDGQKVKTPLERVKLVKEWKEYQPWRVQPTKRVYVPKSNGKLRPLGIPTIKNRVAQAIIKNALEPSWEARFEANSYGFRPGRGCHDAIEQCFARLQKGKDTWVLDADIKGAFDNISHDYILKTIGQVPGRELIKQWLKAGYVESEVFHETEEGTPQGGIASPLLANIALDGMDDWLKSFTKTRWGKTYQYGNQKVHSQHKYRKYGFIRYADDFVITAETKEEIEEILPKIKTWLAQRGLQLNEEKTQIKHISEGFNFLGFNIRQYQGKCLIKPQKEKVKNKLSQIKTWLNSHPNVKPEVVIEVLNPILRGWANYYKHGVSSRTFHYFDHRMVKMLIKWALKKHPNKSVGWIIPKYFGRIGNDHWVFKANSSDRRGQPKESYIYKMATTGITRHVKVKDKASPDDPTLKTYWNERLTKYGKTYFAKGSKLYQIAQNQKWHCPICGEHLFNGERIETHHVLEVTKGGNDEVNNLVHVHLECHKQIHGDKKPVSTGA
ncbi:MAG: group II intron reverse transcriptase/maturase [Scytonema sp. PMC 1069.18]|nr:group II intron reverse transcriptase/maturase [Scytonema sp. PMC 1069.18]MEC4888149.1 group II intron reverse transcriptase/maturase [Scytonema sp. PMC 1070.18]